VYHCQERDNATARQRELESEVESVKDRLEASQRAWSAMRRELDEQKSVRAAEVDRDRLAAAAEGQTKAFKECLARMLSDGCIVVEPFEEMIRERVQVLIIALQDKSAVSHAFTLSVCLSVCLFVCLSVCLSVCVSVLTEQDNSQMPKWMSIKHGRRG